MSFTTNNQLRYIDSFQFLNSSLHGLAKNLSEGEFRYLSQDSASNVVDLVKQKGFYSNEFNEGFEKLKQ